MSAPPLGPAAPPWLILREAVSSLPRSAVHVWRPPLLVGAVGSLAALVVAHEPSHHTPTALGLRFFHVVGAWSLAAVFTAAMYDGACVAARRRAPTARDELALAGFRPPRIALELWLSGAALALPTAAALALLPLAARWYGDLDAATLWHWLSTLLATLAVGAALGVGVGASGDEDGASTRSLALGVALSALGWWAVARVLGPHVTHGLRTWQHGALWWIELPSQPAVSRGVARALLAAPWVLGAVAVTPTLASAGALLGRDRSPGETLRDQAFAASTALLAVASVTAVTLTQGQAQKGLTSLVCLSLAAVMAARFALALGPARGVLSATAARLGVALAAMGAFAVWATRACARDIQHPGTARWVLPLGALALAAGVVAVVGAAAAIREAVGPRRSAGAVAGLVAAWMLGPVVVTEALGRSSADPYRTLVAAVSPVQALSTLRAFLHDGPRWGDLAEMRLRSMPELYGIVLAAAVEVVLGAALLALVLRSRARRGDPR